MFASVFGDSKLVKCSSSCYKRNFVSRCCSFVKNSSFKFNSWKRAKFAYALCASESAVLSLVRREAKKSKHKQTKRDLRPSFVKNVLLNDRGVFLKAFGYVHAIKCETVSVGAYREGTLTRSSHWESLKQLLQRIGTDPNVRLSNLLLDHSLWLLGSAGMKKQLFCRPRHCLLKALSVTHFDGTRVK